MRTEREITTDVVVLSNRLIESKQTQVGGQAQAETMRSLVDLLASEPRAIEILGQLQTNGASTRGGNPVEKPKELPSR